MESSTTSTPATEHTHDDCVQCLQKEVRRLNAALDAKQEEIKYQAAVEIENRHLREALEVAKEVCSHCGHDRSKHNRGIVCPAYDVPTDVFAA